MKVIDIDAIDRTIRLLSEKSKHIDSNDDLQRVIYLSELLLDQRLSNRKFTNVKKNISYEYSHSEFITENLDNIHVKSFFKVNSDPNNLKGFEFKSTVELNDKLYELHYL